MVKGKIKTTCKWYPKREGWIEGKGISRCVMFPAKEKEFPYRIALLSEDVEGFEWQN